MIPLGQFKYVDRVLTDGWITMNHFDQDGKRNPESSPVDDEMVKVYIKDNDDHWNGSVSMGWNLTAKYGDKVNYTNLEKVEEKSDSVLVMKDEAFDWNNKNPWERIRA